jgi:hypothetical protein
MELVQCRQDLMTQYGSRTLTRDTLTWPGFVEQEHEQPSGQPNKTGRNSHLPH